MSDLNLMTTDVKCVNTLKYLFKWLDIIPLSLEIGDY